MPAIHLTDKDFEEKVIKSTLPVLVDFYADWCVDPATRILVDGRQAVAAKTVKTGRTILSFNNGLYQNKVKYSQMVTNGGHCKKILTEVGRSIKTTDDHLFWTDKGWKAAQKLKNGDRVAVYPMVESLAFEKKDNRVIVSENMVGRITLARMRTKVYIDELKKKDLLPLNLISEKTLIIARLMGALFTDGTLYFQESNNYRETSFVLGDKRDVKAVQVDLNKLGFRFHTSERINRQKIGGRSFTSHTYRVKSLSTALWLLFKALGVPVGNKTNQKYGLPEWLLKAPLIIKREFLAGFLGGDGPKLLMFECQRKGGKPYNSLTINDLEFYKRSDLINSGVRLGKQLRRLFKEFGVEIRQIATEKALYKRKDGSQTTVIQLKFRQNFETGYYLATRIGYVYCWSKQKAATQVGEFLGRVMARRNRWQELYRQVQELVKKKGLSSVMIARKLGISEGAAWGWLKVDRKPTSPKHLEKFVVWVKQASQGLKDGLMWDVVFGLESVFLPAVQRITVARQHSFLANGFVVHNCGPCQQAGPIIDELAEEYKDKVLIGKVNVDESHNTSGKYGIMSIPTMVVFKDGKEVERVSGFGGKDGILKLIKKTLEGK